MAFHAPVAEFRHILAHVVDYAAVTGTQRFGEATPDTTEAVLTGAGKLCDEVLVPLQRAGDLHPARLENGIVRTSPGFAEGYRAMAEGGWIGMSAEPEHGGMGLPATLATAVNDMMSGACLALQLNTLMTQGQIDALQDHASPELQRLYLPKLVSGEWCGTMNLTEAQAGSDLGALRTRAEPNGDGSFALWGQKIFISWADNDFTANVCHLVLARLPDAPPGSRGISLFMVPKHLPDSDGQLGRENNTLRVVSLEHKMGLHGSPTAVMAYEGATGWLVGEQHRGLAAMFTMMNNARLGVGVQGIGVAEAAMQLASGHARERHQGRPARGEGPISDHADVRRMLAVMRAETFAARALALDTAVALDLARATGQADHAARAALLTPIAKAHGTQTGISVADLAVQVHGGTGYIEEAGAAQLLRDVRVTAIYEGTNGIQAMDLVGRKLSDGGDAALRMIDAIETGAIAARATLPDLASEIGSAAATLREATKAVLACDPAGRGGGAAAYLRGFARVLGGHYHLRSAMAEGANGPRTALARVFMGRILPEHGPLLTQAQLSDDDLFALVLEDFLP